MGSARVEDLLRDLAPRVLGVLARHHAAEHGGFGACEDAVQEALLAAATRWPERGVPDNPAGWLVTVASRRWTEAWRGDVARRRREETVAAADAAAPVPSVDDTLALLTLCCHPALTTPSQVALTLRAVGGLTTAEIARAFLVPESTIGQRISRAKARIKATGARFEAPVAAEREARLGAVRHVLYLVFNEGYTASSGPALQRVELTAEAIRLTRMLRAAVPEDGETAGLLALMLLTDARRPARADASGALVPLAEQDRSLWDAAMIAEGTALVRDALARAAVGPYQLQAAIAAVHDEAAHAGDTDWRQILGLYELLAVLAPGPMVVLNRAVAVAMADGPEAGLSALDDAAGDPALVGHHRVDAVRAHLLDLAGRREEARAAYELAAGRTLSVPEQRYLRDRARRLS